MVSKGLPTWLAAKRFGNVASRRVTHAMGQRMNGILRF